MSWKSLSNAKDDFEHRWPWILYSSCSGFTCSSCSCSSSSSSTVVSFSRPRLCCCLQYVRASFADDTVYGITKNGDPCISFFEEIMTTLQHMYSTMCFYPRDLPRRNKKRLYHVWEYCTVPYSKSTPSGLSACSWQLPALAGNIIHLFRQSRPPSTTKGIWNIIQYDDLFPRTSPRSSSCLFAYSTPATSPKVRK